MARCVWRIYRVQRTRQTCWWNVLMLGNWGYAKSRLVFCSCCYRCCGAVKMLMMKIFILRMYFLDDWISLQVGKLLGCGVWLIFDVLSYINFRLYYLFSLYSLLPKMLWFINIYIPHHRGSLLTGCYHEILGFLFLSLDLSTLSLESSCVLHSSSVCAWIRF